MSMSRRRRTPLTIDASAIKARFNAVAPFLDERDRRLVAASEAQVAGRGGIAAVALATGIARSTIGRGLAELRGTRKLPKGRIRRKGGGRKLALKTQPGLLAGLRISCNRPFAVIRKQH